MLVKYGVIGVIVLSMLVLENVFFFEKCKLYVRILCICWVDFNGEVFGGYLELKVGVILSVEVGK